jgi:hypothetical protein
VTNLVRKFPRLGFSRKVGGARVFNCELRSDAAADRRGPVYSDAGLRNRTGCRLFVIELLQISPKRILHFG